MSKLIIVLFLKSETEISQEYPVTLSQLNVDWSQALHSGVDTLDWKGVPMSYDTGE